MLKVLPSNKDIIYTGIFIHDDEKVQPMIRAAEEQIGPLPSNFTLTKDPHVTLSFGEKQFTNMETELFSLATGTKAAVVIDGFGFSEDIGLALHVSNCVVKNSDLSWQGISPNDDYELHSTLAVAPGAKPKDTVNLFRYGNGYEFFRFAHPFILTEDFGALSKSQGIVLSSDFIPLQRQGDQMQLKFNDLLLAARIDERIMQEEQRKPCEDQLSFIAENDSRIALLHRIVDITQPEKCLLGCNAEGSFSMIYGANYDNFVLHPMIEHGNLVGVQLYGERIDKDRGLHVKEQLTAARFPEDRVIEIEQMLEKMKDRKELAAARDADDGREISDGEEKIEETDIGDDDDTLTQK